jgi:hypothetical protein
MSSKLLLGFTVANGNPSTGLHLSPTVVSTSSIARMAIAFKYYRFKQIRLEFQPVVRYETTVPSTSASSFWASGYVPESTTSSFTATNFQYTSGLPDSVTGMSQIVNSNVSNNSTLSTGWPGTMMAAGDTEPRILRIRPSALNEGVLRKYACATDYQGQFFFSLADAAGANTVTAYAHMHFTIEFFEPVADDVFGSALLPVANPASLSPYVVDQSDYDEDDRKSQVSLSNKRTGARVGALGDHAPPPLLRQKADLAHAMQRNGLK